ASDNTCTRGSGTQQHNRAAVLRYDRMGDGLAGQRNFGHVTLGTICAFADCIRHTACLADAYTHAPLAIADDDNGAEGESTATLNHFRHALNIDNSFVEFLAFFFAGGAWFTFAAW